MSIMSTPTTHGRWNECTFCGHEWATVEGDIPEQCLNDIESCGGCGYTEHDKLFYMDHRLCPEDPNHRKTP